MANPIAPPVPMALSPISTISRTIHTLRLSPHDTSTEDGRTQERNRRIAWTSLSAAVAKGAAAVTMLVSVPLTLGYLGPERFGLWMAISATIAMLHFADLGLGNGIMNTIAQAKGQDASGVMEQLVSSGVLMLTLIGVCIAALISILYTSIPWPLLFNVSTPLAATESGPVVLVLTACFVANLPLAATQKVQLGLQRGYLANFWDAVGSLTGLAGVLVAINAEAGLPWIAFAMAGTPVIFRAVNTLVFFAFQMPALRPRLNFWSASVAGRLLRTGSLFFVLQLAVIVGMQSDNIIIARILGAASVSSYDVAMKVATLPAMFVGFFVIAQWPAYAEAAGRGDQRWIRRTFRTTVLVSLSVAVPFALLLFVFGAQVIEFWAGPEVIPSRALLSGMAIWSVLAVLGGAIAALLNGLHIIRFQVINSILMATSNILLSIALVHRFGLPGAIFGSVLSYITFTMIPCWYYIRRLLSAMSLPDAKSPVY